MLPQKRVYTDQKKPIQIRGTRRQATKTSFSSEGRKMHRGLKRNPQRKVTTCGVFHSISAVINSRDGRPPKCENNSKTRTGPQKFFLFEVVRRGRSGIGHHRILGKKSGAPGGGRKKRIGGWEVIPAGPIIFWGVRKVVGNQFQLLIELLRENQNEVITKS